MLRFENVATPETAVRTVVPERVPPLGFAPITTVIEPEKPVAVLPSESCAVTLTAGDIKDPAAVVLGSTVNAKFVAAPPLTLKALLVLLMAPDVASSRYPEPTLS